MHRNTTTAGVEVGLLGVLHELHGVLFNSIVYSGFGKLPTYNLIDLMEGMLLHLTMYYYLTI